MPLRRLHPRVPARHRHFSPTTLHLLDSRRRVGHTTNHGAAVTDRIDYNTASARMATP
jgi:hypothetical protein